MSSIGNELFLLMSNLTLMSNQTRIISLFIEAINSYNNDFSINYIDENYRKLNNVIDIRTINKSFGYFVMSGDMNVVSKDFEPLFQNSVQMLAVILEKLSHERFIAHEKLLLKSMLNEKTLNLLESEEKYRSLVENSSDIIARYDKNNRHIFVSSSISSIYQKLPDEFIGKTHRELGFELELVEFWEIKIQNVFYKKTEIQSEFYIKVKNEIRYFDLKLIPEYDNKNNVESVLSITHDITNRKKNERDIIIAKEKAEQSDKLKTSFLQNMSHEIRTPLNGIVGFISLMKNSKNLSEEKKEIYMDIILKSSDYLLSIVNDLIDVSIIDSKSLNIVKANFTLGELINHINIIFQKKIYERGLEFKVVNLIEIEDVILYSDKDKILQIITNLINNAIKFTEYGKIELGCNLSESGVEIYISDTGIGIDKVYHRKIYQRFWQYEALSGKKYGGTGLGLSIVKDLTDFLDINLSVDSEIGKGTKFIIKFDKRSISNFNEILLNKTDSDKFDYSKLKVLVVEDEEINFIYLETLLKMENIDVCWAKNGIEAIESITNQKFDVILMDLKMPIMDGYETASRIKENNPKIPIIIQTAYVQQEEKVKAFKLGCNEFISKPIARDVLFKVLKKVTISLENN